MLFNYYIKILVKLILPMTLLNTKNCLLTCLLILFWHNAILGETAYVADKMRVGLYPSENLDSKIIKILKTGDKLEILKETELMALVKDDFEVVGWIDKNYLMKNRPAASLLRDLTERNNKSVLQKNKTNLSNKERPNIISVDPKIKALTKRNTQLKAKIAQILPRVKQCESRASISEKENEQLSKELALSCPSSALTKGETVPLKAFQNLERQLIEANEAITPPVNRENFMSSDSPSSIAIIKTYWIWGIGGILILVTLGAVLGAYLLDYFNRKRHGGFRI